MKIESTTQVLNSIIFFFYNLIKGIITDPDSHDTICMKYTFPLISICFQRDEVAFPQRNKEEIKDLVKT